MRARLFRIAACLLALCLLLASCTPISAYLVPEEGEAYVHFIDVGQGDATLIRTREAIVLIDTGEGGDGAEAAVLSYLRRFSIERIDLLVLSHPHSDHMGGAIAVLDAYEVGACLLPRAVSDTLTCRETLDAIEAEGCKIEHAEAGKTLMVGDVEIFVLSPFFLPLDDANADAAVVRVDIGEASLLMMSDATEATEEAILDAYDTAVLDADLMKVGHHGSKYSTTSAFLDAVTPAHAVISCGAHNEYGFPTPEAVARILASGCTLHRTDTDGTVVFRLKNGEVLPIN